VIGRNNLDVKRKKRGGDGEGGVGFYAGVLGWRFAA